MRSGTEQCGSRIAVRRGGRGRRDNKDDKDDEKDEEEEEEDEEAGGRRKDATLIKSNNPHLAGGEKKTQDTKITIKSRTGLPHFDDTYLIDSETNFGEGAVTPDFIAERCREHKHHIKSLDTLIFKIYQNVLMC